MKPERDPASPAPGKAPGATKLEYLPALDGLRAVCLTAVLLFHAPFSWMSGGFLGVSTFFTLSGYLIATLLLGERHARGRIDIAAFWDRRLRRLGPALWVGVLGVVASAPWWLTAEGREGVLADAAATLSYVSNWRFMAPEYAYAQLFSDPSPLQHSWSLSIEAQYYLVFPLALAWSFRRGAGSRRFAGVLLVFVAVSLAAAVVDPGDSDATNRVYYGTLSRAAEPVAGALLALVLALGPRPGGRGWDRLVTIAGSLVAVAMLVAWSTSEVGSPWLYGGGFALHAALSALLIFAILRPGNPLGRLLSLPPLPWIGRISYGAYVYHWPIFLILSPERTGLSTAPLFAVRVLLTLGCAWASQRFIEHPVRSRRVLGGRRAIFAVSLAIPLTLVAATMYERPRFAFDATGVSTEEAVRILGRQPRISGFGDSRALLLRGTLLPWLASLGMENQPDGVTLGCSLMNRGERYFWSGWAPIRPACRDSLSRWRQRVTEYPTDVVVVFVGPWEVVTRRFAEGEPARAFGDPVFDLAFSERIDEAVAMFGEQGSGTIWLTSPPVEFAGERWRDRSMLQGANDPARMDRLNALLRDAAARWPDDLRVVDFAGYLREREIDLSRADIRPDGVHFEKSEAVAEIVDTWLGPEVVKATNELIAIADQRSRAGANRMPEE